tara:strand:- start:684 stop:1256 length:573 start_codon:yes stop_codon:yes gene_type:complete
MSFRAVITGVALVMTLGTGTASAQNPVVVMETSLGSITIELDQANAPISVENFLQYANDGFYEGTLFHRVIPSFMIQGGGFTSGMSQKTTRAAIKNEADNGVSNARGTIAMARTNVVDSATSQFFINHGGNNAGSLDHSGPGAAFGYAVFGRVTEGMDVVDKIASVATTRREGHGDVPVEDVTINSITVQ